MKTSLLILPAVLMATTPFVGAVTVLGTGTGALIGGDLTDPENDGTPTGDNYNATFAASEEASFSSTGETAFNVFNNTVGGGSAKWCCGGESPGVFPIFVDATFASAVTLTQFTLTSGNDSPLRDPRVWQIQGSNDGVNFTTIFSQDDAAASAFSTFNQVIRWDGGGADFATPDAYTTLRFNVDATGLNSGALFQLNEIEYFGTAIPEPSSAILCGLAGFGLLLRRRK